MGGWVGSVQVPRGLGKEENGGGWEAGEEGVKVGHKTSAVQRETLMAWLGPQEVSDLGAHGERRKHPVGESRALILSLATPSGSLEEFTEEQKLLEIFFVFNLKLRLHWVFAASSRLSQVAESRDTLVAACRLLSLW